MLHIVKAVVTQETVALPIHTQMTVTREVLPCVSVSVLLCALM